MQITHRIVVRGAAAVLAVAVVAHVVAAQQSAAPVTSSSLTAAQQSLAAGRAVEAARLADLLLATAPGNRDAVDVRLRAAVAEGDQPAARRTYARFMMATGKQDVALLRLVALGELKIAATSDDGALKMAALVRLARSGDQSAAKELTRISSEAAGTGEGAMADSALATLGDKAAYRRLAAAASSPRIRDKSIVAKALQDANATNEAYALVPLLRDQSPVTRMKAAEALGVLGHKRAIPELRVLLADDSPAVRAMASLALKRLGDGSGDAMVKAMLESPVPSVRLTALEATRASDQERVATSARQGLNDRDGLTRVKAAETLVQKDRAAALAVLTRVVERDDVAVRREAARVIETAAEVDPALVQKLLADSNEWVRLHGAGAAVKTSVGGGATSPRVR